MGSLAEMADRAVRVGPACLRPKGPLECQGQLELMEMTGRKGRQEFLALQASLALMAFQDLQVILVFLESLVCQDFLPFQQFLLQGQLVTVDNRFLEIRSLDSTTGQ